MWGDAATLGRDDGGPSRTDVAVAAGFLVAGLAEALLGGNEGNRLIYVGAVVLASVPLVWRRRYPAVCFLVVVLPLGPGVVLSTRTDDLLVALAAMLLAAFSLGLHAGRRELAIGLVVGAVLIGGAILIGGEGPDDLLYAALLVGLAVVPAHLLRRRLAEVARLTERAVRAEIELQESTKIAAAEERTRLAREMHDIIGHGVSLMVVHAGAAEARLQEPEVARQSLLAVQEAGRQAVTDLARLLGLLRDEHAEIGLAPQPGLHDLDRLAGSARSGGDALTLTIAGDAGHVPAAVGLAAYRVVQEGLTNARRHAPGAPVDVRVDVATDDVSVRVANDRPPRPPGETSRGTGAGIAGLRERVALFDGRLGAGPDPVGGYVLVATIPFRSVEP